MDIIDEFHNFWNLLGKKTSSWGKYSVSLITGIVLFAYTSKPWRLTNIWDVSTVASGGLSGLRATIMKNRIKNTNKYINAQHKNSDRYQGDWASWFFLLLLLGSYDRLLYDDSLSLFIEVDLLVYGKYLFFIFNVKESFVWD